ncbi:MAG: Flp pilus assembly protein CpaB [Planctomycetia bacterium]|nr:Flp pilus assembly protein CpaB [Planctomycetia bacterium]
MARISTGTMTVAIFAVLFGLVGAYALRAALTKPEVEPPPPPKTIPVPIASVAIPAGRQITLGDMVLLPMTGEDMRNRKYNLEQVMLDSSQIIGRILQTEMKPGDPFLTVNMYAQGTGPKLSDKLKPGMRAVTIAIDNLNAVGGSTVEGSFVDILFRARKRAADLANDRPEIPATTVTLLENVEVLSVGRIDMAARRGQEEENVDVRDINSASIGKGYGSNYQGAGVVSVTIAVSPDQANVLKAVIGQGDMSLSLRNEGASGAPPAPQGQSSATPNKYTLESVLGIKNASIAGLDKIEIFRGGWSRQNVHYQNDKVIREEVSLIPGIAPSTPFPVPAKVPAAQEPATNGSDDKTFSPSPRIINNGFGNSGQFDNMDGGRRFYGR